MAKTNKTVVRTKKRKVEEREREREKKGNVEKLTAPWYSGLRRQTNFAILLAIKGCWPRTNISNITHGKL